MTHRLIIAAKEALAIVRGEKPAAKVVYPKGNEMCWGKCKHPLNCQCFPKKETN